MFKGIMTIWQKQNPKQHEPETRINYEFEFIKMIPPANVELTPSIEALTQKKKRYSQLNG